VGPEFENPLRTEVIDCRETSSVNFVLLFAESRLIHTCYAAPMLFMFTCLSLANPCLVDSHMPCRAPAILRQCRALRESPRGSRKYANCQSYSLTDWYISGNNLRGTPRGSKKKPNAGRSPSCRLRTADADSHMPKSRPCRAMPWP
jgi:hypothetical protein